MTVFVLADRQPQVGQVVLYRLRPVDELVPATYDGQAWVSGEHRQTARAHHEWVETDTPPPPASSRAQLRAVLQLHPELIEEWP